MNKTRLSTGVSQILPFMSILVVVLLFFNKMAFSNLILARGDTFLYFYPYWQAAAEALHDGRIPLWNPNLFMGVPFLANSQVGFFYPLNWPFWWWLPTPYAVSASIIFHLIIAAYGAYWAGRRMLSMSKGAAWVTAVLFACGGYLTAQVEHINQLQGLAWLPWFFVAIPLGAGGGWRIIGRRGAVIAILFCLQLTAGHTQTTFITGFGMLIYLIVAGWPYFREGGTLKNMVPIWLGPIIIGGILALLMTAVQLLPTLELVEHSSRQGGLPVNEVLSFSLQPLLLGRSLLPGYGQSLFTEYVAFLPLTALVLSVVGLWQWRHQPRLRPFGWLAIIGLLLALGRFTPIYWLLARLPGFDLFRVPARWLALFSLGMAMLAGYGFDVVAAQWHLPDKEWRAWVQRPFRAAMLIILTLVIWSFLSVALTKFIPIGPEAPPEMPSWLSILGWGLEIGALGFVLIKRFRGGKTAILATLVFVQYLAARALPYNQLTTPEAYFDWRPTIARIKAGTDISGPTGRLLSLSTTFFDPGDGEEIEAIYLDQLPEQARYDYIVAVKQKEILAPNLPLTFGLASVDGFDGGILPLSSYSHLTKLILPNQKPAVDGRLREQLTAVPEARWLDLFNTRYIITDKTGDSWHAFSPDLDVYFDRQHPFSLENEGNVEVGHVPAFPATGLAVIADGEVGTVRVTTVTNVWEFAPEPLTDGLLIVDWTNPEIVESIEFIAPAPGRWDVAGVSLVNEDNLTFHALVAGQYRLIHSGDVKIYENLDVLPRAFLLADWSWHPDVDSVLSFMGQAGFEPRETAALIGEGIGMTQQGGVVGSVNIEEYQPERVTLWVESEVESLLILTDAYYPGWVAKVNGIPTPIYEADILFRGIMVPAGQHHVEFSFGSRSFENGRILSYIGLAFWLLVLLATVVNDKSKVQPST